MTDRLSNDELDRLDKIAEAATSGPWEVEGSLFGPEAHSLGQAWGLNWRDDLALIAAARNALPALLSEVRASRERETRREYAVARPASMPDMSGRERWTLIVSSTFPSLGRAEEARQRVPSLRDRDAVIVSRIAPGSDWEAVTGDD